MRKGPAIKKNGVNAKLLSKWQFTRQMNLLALVGCD